MLANFIAYTTFNYSKLEYVANSSIEAKSAGESQAWLYDQLPGDISVTITNTGKMAAAEAAQLYLSFKSSHGLEFPPQQLRGFQKVFLEPGQSKSVKFYLRKKDVSYWNVIEQK